MAVGMRAAWTLITACAIFVLKSAASSTAGGDQTDRRALNLVTGPSRQEANASAVPSILEAHDSASAVNEIDHELSNDEERSGVEVPPEIVEELGTMVQPFVARASEALEETGVQLRHSQKALEETGVQEEHLVAGLKKIDVGADQKRSTVVRSLKQWIKQADTLHRKLGSFDDTAIVDSLLTKFEGENERLVDFFVWLTLLGGGWNDRAIKLQRVLRDKLSLEKITPLWLEENIAPDDVFHMMLIGEQPRLKPDTDAEAAWPDILAKALDWFAYCDRYGSEFASDDAFDVLIEFRGEEEVLRLSTSLPSSMKRHAHTFQVMLYDQFPDMRPRLIDIWLKSGTTPLEALDLLSISRACFDWLENKEMWGNLMDRVKAWIRVNDEFMARSLLFSRDEDKIKLRSELRDAIEKGSGDGATAAQKTKKVEAMTTLLKDETIRMLKTVEPLPSMPEDMALVTLLKDGTEAQRVMEQAIDKGLTRRVYSRKVVEEFRFMRKTIIMLSRVDTT